MAPYPPHWLRGQRVRQLATASDSSAVTTERPHGWSTRAVLQAGLALVLFAGACGLGYWAWEWRPQSTSPVAPRTQLQEMEVNVDHSIPARAWITLGQDLSVPQVSNLTGKSNEVWIEFDLRKGQRLRWAVQLYIASDLPATKPTFATPAGTKVRTRFYPDKTSVVTVQDHIRATDIRRLGPSSISGVDVNGWLVEGTASGPASGDAGSGPSDLGIAGDQALGVIGFDTGRKSPLTHAKDNETFHIPIVEWGSALYATTWLPVEPTKSDWSVSVPSGGLMQNIGGVTPSVNDGQSLTWASSGDSADATYVGKSTSQAAAEDVRTFFSGILGASAIAILLALMQLLVDSDLSRAIFRRPQDKAPAGSTS